MSLSIVVSLSMTRPSQFLRLIINLTSIWTNNFFERPLFFLLLTLKVGLSLFFVPDLTDKDSGCSDTCERAGGASVADERLGTCGRCV